MFTRRSWLVVLLASLGCGGAPTAPSLPPVSSTQAEFLGTVSSLGTLSPLSGVTVAIVAGSNAGRTMTTDVNGQFHMTGLASGSNTFRFTAPGHAPHQTDLWIPEGGSVGSGGFALRPYWNASGSGDATLMKPSVATPVRITAQVTGPASGFTVRCDQQVVVSVAFDAASEGYEGTHAMNCTQVRVENAAHVSWLFQEIAP